MAAGRRRTVDKSAQQRRERRASFAQANPKGHKRSIGASTTTETPMHVRALGVELPSGLREQVRDRVGRKLGKFGLAITRISVRFEDVSGPIGAPVFECRFKVVLRRAADVLQAAQGETARAAFDKALMSVERTVRRTLEKGTAARTRGRTP